jgi:pimeloyl-ACP methyl ester carboxylesterase
MNSANHFIDNHGVRIHAIEFNASDERTPLVIVPGMINSADEVAASISTHLTWRTIILSVRGRGKSDSPEKGWSIEDQASDVAAVIGHFAHADVILFGHSVGASIGARSIPMLSAKVRAFIVGDYAPVYPPFTDVWRQRVLEVEDRQISDTALTGIIESPQRTLVAEYLEPLGSSVYILKGELQDSLLQPEHLDRLKTVLPLAQIEILHGCGHEFLSEDPKGSMMVIERIARAAEGPPLVDAAHRYSPPS